MAPEQAKGYGKIGTHTDVYALGVLFFEILSGQPPFTADGAMELIGQHMFSPPPRVNSIVPNVDIELDELVNRMLSKDPANRPSMREIKNQLGKINRRLSSASGRSSIARENSDISQAETLVYRSSEHSATVAIPKSTSDLVSRLLQKRALLAGAILIGIIVLLAIWLLIRSLTAAPSSNEKFIDDKVNPKKKIGKEQTIQTKPTDSLTPTERNLTISTKSNGPTKTRLKSRGRKESKDPKESMDQKESTESSNPAPKIVD